MRLLTTRTILPLCSLLALITVGCGRTSEPERQPAGSGDISGVVFDDKNRNGTLDADDARLPGQTVLLTSPDRSTEVGSTNTAADGSFRLNDIAPGEYRLGLVIPDGFRRTTDDSLLVTITPGGPAIDINFGIAAAE